MNTQYKVWIATFITITLWATSFPICKLLVTEVSAMHVAAIRITFSGLFLFLIALVKGLKYPRSLVDWGWMLLGALTGTLLYQICFNIGLITITSTTSSIIEAITPLTTAIMAAIILGEKLSPTGWLYSCTAFIGTAILILWDGALSMQIGVLWTIGAVFSSLLLILSAAAYLHTTTMPSPSQCGLCLFPVY